MAKLVSKTYGEAIFDLAVEENVLGQVQEEIQFVKDVLNENAELVSFLNHPKITKEEKVRVVENIFKGKLGDITVGFLVTVVNKERYGQLIEIFEYFEDKVRQFKNIGVVSVTSAIELTEEQKSKLTDRLLKITGFAELEFVYFVEPEIIGGMIIRIGDRIVDSSIRTKIDVMAKDMSKVQLS
ncbi:ATP synthase F1 subunit delta [Anaeromicropila populeti]|uniref:ATP synthase subunit delta n=1 Tax=Anaeromicropila populeti TaxID=37658 RepID=A0A1I6I885_9FIRM|nr:ATP synthase F1 subunit delta [Anaeromicropila populeti]SFR62848.1 F-type H+-transporting ATPase subunit delta [Anaeromicropila populeti]